MMDILKRAFTYNINAGALDELRAKGLPAAVLEQLGSLRGSRFRSQRELAAALPQAIGESATARYGRQVIAAARVLRPKRIARIIATEWNNRVPPSRLLPGWNAYIGLRPFIFSLRFRLRWCRFALARKGSARGVVEENRNPNASGFEHNRKQVMSFLEGHRNRTESIINVLRTIQGYDFASTRVLCVGPRNEAEVLLLRLYGFRPENVKAIDLFSYSPLIDLMDMNDLRYPADHFDVYYSSAVIKYSPDIRRTVSEATRVTRNGGLMVFGFMFGALSDLIPEGSDLSGGLAELLALFEDHVDHVYWREEFPYEPGDTRASIIFRLRK
jgi:hypothetical protein